MQQLRALWAPQLLTVDQMCKRKEISMQHLAVLNLLGLLHRLVTMDETCIHPHTPPTTPSVRSSRKAVDSTKWKYSKESKDHFVDKGGEGNCDLGQPRNFHIDYSMNGKIKKGKYCAISFDCLKGELKKITFILTNQHIDQKVNQSITQYKCRDFSEDTDKSYLG